MSSTPPLIYGRKNIANTRMGLWHAWEPGPTRSGVVMLRSLCGLVRPRKDISVRSDRPPAGRLCFNCSQYAALKATPAASAAKGEA